ncbi:MAG: alpha/beta fold hydrolase [Deltaproteobacteria bacterium]|nr:alpha/beta fold hydrolase [Deltaproteobacteria bacterium]
MPFLAHHEVKLHYAISGSGPPLLLLAGTSLDTRVWDRVAKDLSQSLTLVAMDLRGSGLSDAPRGPYAIRGMVEDVRALVEHLGLGSVPVAGHSMGGFVALAYALDASRAVSGLALISTAASGNPGVLGADPAIFEAFARRGPAEEVLRESLLACLGRTFKAAHGDEAEAFVAERIERPPRGAGLAGQMAAAAGFDARQKLAGIKCPTLVVHGDEDEVIPLARAEELARGIPGSVLHVLAGVGHMPQLEAPREIARLLVGFFDARRAA